MGDPTGHALYALAHSRCRACKASANNGAAGRAREERTSHEPSIALVTFAGNVVDTQRLAKGASTSKRALLSRAGRIQPDLAREPIWIASRALRHLFR